MERERGVKNIFALLKAKKEISFMFLANTRYVIFSVSVVQDSNSNQTGQTLKFVKNQCTWRK